MSRKGLGKGAKRRRNVPTDNLQGISKPAIRRLARRGGVKRISGLVYEETRGVLKAFLENVLHDAIYYTEHARRKTISAMDVMYALKRQGRTLYGYGDGRRATRTESGTAPMGPSGIQKPRKTKVITIERVFDFHACYEDADEDNSKAFRECFKAYSEWKPGTGRYYITRGFEDCDFPVSVGSGKKKQRFDTYENGIWQTTESDETKGVEIVPDYAETIEDALRENEELTAALDGIEEGDRIKLGRLGGEWVYRTES